MEKRLWPHVLSLQPEKPGNQDTLRRHYCCWRDDRNIPYRCENEGCPLHTPPLIWNGEKITLSLDHKDGQKRNSTPDNLRFLCSNCASQPETHGGGNVGRVINHSANCYEIQPRSGPRKFF